MAQSEHLPIYKACYDLFLYFEQAVQGFSRTHRFSLGGDLRDLSRKALRLVVRANSQADKVPALLELRCPAEPAACRPPRRSSQVVRAARR